MFPLPPLAGKGRVIALEGLDGSGTTTQTHLLCERLRDEGLGAVRTREPSDGPVGTMVRQVLAGKTRLDASTLAALFAADRLDHQVRVIRPVMAAGDVVVTDRSVVSSLVYQGAEVPEMWVRAINARSTLPHLVIWLDVPVLLCMQRIEQRRQARERYEQVDVLERLHRRYEGLMKVGIGDAKLVRVDGTSGPETVLERIWDAVRASHTLDALLG